MPDLPVRHAKARIERANRFYYPDIMLCCNPLATDVDDYFETDPKLIVEVLSPRMVAINDGEKRVNCQTLSSLEEYLLLEPKMRQAVLYRRSGALWPRICLSSEDGLELLSIGFHRDLAEAVGLA